MSDPNKSFLEATDPFVLFSDWMAEAQSAEPNDPNAMSVATIDGAGLPDVRVFLLKGFDERGFPRSIRSQNCINTGIIDLEINPFQNCIFTEAFM